MIVQIRYTKLVYVLDFSLTFVSYFVYDVT